tara:strand:- start:354 stop:533 length:180 start_codon:yes stop_codon:yes gene_type:complete
MGKTNTSKKYPKAVMLYMTDGMYAALKRMADEEERPLSNQLRYIIKDFITAHTMNELLK